MANNVKNLVIVESPSKAKTIEKYLGKDFLVKASMGHLRDLPKSTMGVDFDNDFAVQYQAMPGKEKVIAELKRCAETAENVYLATDPDREGEAISWHLKELLEIPENKILRVTFNEITRSVVQKAIEAPRGIDYNLVDAQQARRVLDRIVGYKLSPLLWKKVRKGLSAGRVQSVAVRLVVDREKEINAFEQKEFWTIESLLERVGQEGKLSAQYYGSPKKQELPNEGAADAVIAEVKGKEFLVTTVKKTEKKRSPAPPFITSTLQQEASRKLNMTPRYTMSVAQQLYEGVEVTGEDSVGLITYMRTDSQRISEEALSAAGEYIKSHFGDAYYNGSPRRFKSKGNAQDAHEAIRPSNLSLDPEKIRGDLSKDQYRLYKLIWDRFIASQMACVLYDAVAVDLTCGEHVFHASNQTMKFAGFTAIYEEGKDDEVQEPDTALPDLTEGERLLCKDANKQQHFTQPPARYTEATLVRAMEEKGIGRPSTYATIVSTIENKEYVLKKDKRLYPTPLGQTINDQMLMIYFTDIIGVEFTAEMEQRLDKIEDGSISWKAVLRDFYTGFSKELASAEEALRDTRIRVPDEVSDEICDICGRNMVVKIGPFGKFLACPGYPECKNTKPIVEHMPGRCPKCGSGILKRTSKNGHPYYACEKGAACGFMSWDVPTAEDCPVCKETMFKRAGKGRMKPFCINPNCENFLPEDKRGYYKKKTDDGEEKKTVPEKKKTTSRKSPSKGKKA